MQSEPTVFVVDDDEAVRQSLQLLAESVGYPVRAFGSAAEFLESYRPDQPGCLVLDIRMRGMSGLELQDWLAAQGLSLPIIFVTGHGDIPMAVQAMRAGAVDFIEKPYRDQELLDRIQQAIELDEQRRQQDHRRQQVSDRLDLLTPREREVMEHVVAGETNKQIAGALGISLRAVEAHRARVMERMAASSVAQLVQMVMTVRAPEGGPYACT